MEQVFVLYEGGHIKPIHPIKIFPFEDIPAAFAYMRGGRHIGKIVISNGEKAEVKVPVRPAPRPFELRADASYFIVGGLRGLCGSLAIHMAQHGAKHIVAFSRSGCDDDRSQRIIENCKSFGCQVYGAKGDVSSFDDVNKALKDVPAPVAGVIQGAMLLRVSVHQVIYSRLPSL